jgi:hypothetical protein
MPNRIIPNPSVPKITNLQVLDIVRRDNSEITLSHQGLVAFRNRSSRYIPNPTEIMVVPIRMSANHLLIPRPGTIQRNACDTSHLNFVHHNSILFGIKMMIAVNNLICQGNLLVSTQNRILSHML